MPSRTSQGGQGQGPSPSLKTLLKAADTLLKPPDPIPSAPPALLKRLRACSKCLPREWRRAMPEWKDEDEMDHIGDESSGTPVDADDAGRRQARRDQLVVVVAKRSFALVRAIQKWLEKEFWPQDQRGGLEQKDFLLGTADLRLIRIMLSWTNPTYLLWLTASYADRLPDIDESIADSLASTIQSLLEFVKPVSPPAPAAGPSSRVPSPPTVITQILTSGHLIYIGLAALTIAWTPSVPQEKYAPLRTFILEVFMSLSPAHAISTLGSILKLLTQGRMENVKPNGWLRKWPKYPDSRVNQFLTLQVRRPGGVRGMMEVMLGEAAKTNDGATIDGTRLDHIYNLLVRIPHSMTQETYFPWLLAELFSLIPVNDSSPVHPTAYVSSACYCIQRFYTSNAPGVADWLKVKLHAPWTPSPWTYLSKPLPHPVIVTTPEAIQRSLQNIRFLLLYNPTTPKFADFLLTPILIPLFSLHAYLSWSSESAPISVSKQQKNNSSGQGTPQNLVWILKDDVACLLQTWGKMVDSDTAVKGIWSIIDGREGWSTLQQGFGTPCFSWQGTAPNVQLVAGTPEIPSTADIITRHASESGLADHLDLLPRDIAKTLELLCQMIQGIDRADITSEVIIRALDLWRISEAAGTASQTDILLKFCLTLEIMKHSGPQAFAKPLQMLHLIERVLHDHALSLTKKPPSPPPVMLVEEVDSKGQKRPQRSGAESIDNDLLVKLACDLLESLKRISEAKGEQDIFESRLVHPILAHLKMIATHSPSNAVRGEARGACLMLEAHVQHSSDPTPSSRTGNGSGQAQRKQHEQAVAFAGDSELPVRALGLNMLKDLVSAPDFDKSLVHPILDVYMKNLADDDSFIYLNAVSGLSEMVDVLGKEVFGKLIEGYRVGALRLVEDGEKEKKVEEAALEVTLRLGEAIDQVIKRTGEALGKYAGEIVPTLMSLYPNTKLPTVIQTSALSLLSTCAETSYLSVLPWATGLADSLLDLIQVESVPLNPFRPDLTGIGVAEAAPRPGEPGWKPVKKKIQLVDDEPVLAEAEAEEEDRQQIAPRVIDEDPVEVDGRHPALRRAALMLLDWVFRSIATELWPEAVPRDRLKGRAADDGEGDGSFQTRTRLSVREGVAKTQSPASYISPMTVKRARTVLTYMAQTDEDEVVRDHAVAVDGGAQVLELGMGMGMRMGMGVGEGIKAVDGLRVLGKTLESMKL